jgi:hypothetical protein
VRSGIINASNQESNTVRPFTIMLGISLGSVANRCDGALDGEGATIGKTGGKGLLL